MHCLPNETGFEIASEISLATSCCSAMSSIISCTWSTSLRRKTITFILHENYVVKLIFYICWWAAFSASAAFFIVVRTAVLVLALSRASRCISIVDKVPSICCNCFSYRFFLFSAWSAAIEYKFNTINQWLRR